MFAKEKVLDDLARAAGGTISALSGLNTQIKGDIRARIDEAATRMNLVPREDFEKLEAMLVKSREEQEQLARRVEALEEALAKTKKK